MTRFLAAPVLVMMLLSPAFAAAPEIKTYKNYFELLQAIHEVQQADRPMTKKGLVIEAWTMGKLIENHVTEHKLWSDYSAEINPRLAKDLSTTAHEVAQRRRFARLYPEAIPSYDLSWAHYTEAFDLKDAEQRAALFEQCEKEKCSVTKLREELKKIPRKETNTTHSAMLPQMFHLYPVAKEKQGENKDKLVLQLGFSDDYTFPGLEAFKEGDILSCPPETACVLAPAAKTSDLFVYPAEAVQIIDGDTMDVAVNLGFGIMTTRRLRLRGIDAAELNTRKGVAAKTFVFDEITKAGGRIILKVGALDKYDRYLADIWVNGQYLNQALVDQGFAKAVGE